MDVSLKRPKLNTISAESSLASRNHSVATIGMMRGDTLVATQSSVPAASVSSSPNSYATAAPYRSSLFNHDVPHRCPRCHALRRVRAARARSEPMRALAPACCSTVSNSR